MRVFRIYRLSQQSVPRDLAEGSVAALYCIEHYW